MRVGAGWGYPNPPPPPNPTPTPNQAFDDLAQTSPPLTEAGEYELRVTHTPPQGGEPSLEQDCWKYSADHRWAWAAGECVSHLTVLLYLNDDFEGGETVLYPGTHASETPEDGSPQVAIRPAAGSALCFGQSFKFGREGVAHSSDALLHEGAPLASPTGGSASAKYVLRTDVCYTLPRR